MSSPTGWALSLCASLSLLLGVTATLSRDARQDAKPVSKEAANKAVNEPAKQATQQIDLSKALKLNLPAAARDLEAASFATPDGRSGWVLRIPGGRPIATPAYADGMLF